MLRKTELASVYTLIEKCHLCPQMDPQKVKRRITAGPCKADLFVISQALARETQRLSGVPFFTLSGKLGRTGTALERFLGGLGHTLYPQEPIRLSNGNCIPAKARHLLTAYHTDIIQCYPGPSENGGDRRPTRKEIEACLSCEYLRRELEAVRPSVVLLVGAIARTNFYLYVLGQRRGDTLTDQMESIRRSGSLPRERVGELQVRVAPIFHPSGANAFRFALQLRDSRIIGVIRNELGLDVP